MEPSEWIEHNTGGGCDFSFPDGIYGEPVFYDSLYEGYTVPEGQTLYITNVYTPQGLYLTQTDNLANDVRIIENH